jgi:hypothetical protein
MAATATIEDIKSEIEDLNIRYPSLLDDQLFVLWFQHAYLVEGEINAADTLTGASNDKGVDAILIDDKAKTIFITQGKYRKDAGKKQENRSDVTSFASLGQILWIKEKREFEEFCDAVDPLVKDRLEEARERLQRRKGYSIVLYYVTLGRCSRGLAGEAERIARQANGPTEVVILDYKQVLRLMDDYLDGVAPPVRSLDLRVESRGRPGSSGVIDRYDAGSGIESWVFTMTGSDIGELYSRTGKRLFARNIRGFLGNTQVNRAMEGTLSNRPEYFWYFNNGVTIVCDEARMIKERGREIIRVDNPQVINGQQTTRVLQSKDSLAGKASVLVRVISIPRAKDNSDGHFEEIVSSIVEATNWQNSIRASDLVANDRQQILIERELRKLGYQYLRKRETKAEARRSASSQCRYFVTKEEFARSVAACAFDPVVVRSGVERLFEENFYTSIFRSGEAEYYLQCYWLMKRAELVARGYPERAYAKWVVLHFMWDMTGRDIGHHSTRFIKACERYWLQDNQKILTALEKAINTAYITALEFYRKTREGSGPTAQDISTFFLRRDLHKQFNTYWNSPDNKHKNVFNRSIGRLKDALKE